MPGIAGFTNGGVKSEQCNCVIRKMQESITHFDFYAKDELFNDGTVCATRSHINVIQKKQQPYHESGMYVWLDGEFYNQYELSSSINGTDSDPQILLNLFKQGHDYLNLRKIDGVFTAAIYDSLHKKVHLVSDRYGIRFMFWTIHQGSLAWCSELKGMLTLPNFRPEIDLMAVTDFFHGGYLRDDRTWFKQVGLLPGGSVLTWDIEGRALSCHCYWSWDAIKPLECKINEDEIGEELGRLFKEAVRNRCRENERVGLGLSGGLDSRAVIAAVPEECKPLHVLTFGKRGGSEIKIARIVAKQKGAIHHYVEINSQNWLAPRVTGVWRTDGMMDMKHMHGIESHLTNLYEIGLGGHHARLLKGNHFHKTKDEFELFNNDERKFINYGPILAQSRKVIRRPFLDNKLFSFTVSLPKNVRLKMNIYKKFLLATFPEYFTTIPYQRFGVPISSSQRIQELSLGFRRLRKKLLKETGRLGINYSDPYTYTDYPNWMRGFPARSLFELVLNNPAALYHEYLPGMNVRRMLERHWQGEDLSEHLCRCLTFELWLQQVFEKNYREYSC